MLRARVDADGGIAYLWGMAVEEEDDLDEGEISRLHAALERSLDDIKAGRVHDAAVVVDELRAVPCCPRWP